MNFKSLLKIAGMAATLVMPALVYAQSDLCTVPDNKKVHKWLTELTKEETIDERKAKLITELLDEIPGFIPAIYERAVLRYEYFLIGKTTPQKVMDDLTTVEDACSEKFPLIPYYKGSLYYQVGDFEGALPHFNNFIKNASNLSEESSLALVSEAKKNAQLAEFYIRLESDTLDVKIESVTGVNTEASEFLPMLSPDNSTLYFTKKWEVKYRGDFKTSYVEKLMSSQLEVDGSINYTAPEEMPFPFNEGEGNYGGVSITVNNRELFITQCIFPQAGEQGDINCDIFKSQYKYFAEDEEGTYFTWSKLEPLESVNGKDSWESQPCISADGKTLYYAKYDANRTRGIDIYYSLLNEDGTWGEGSPIPGKVNTAGNDKAPFIHPDGNTLYFSSDGHPGAGGYDIFFSRKDEQGFWGRPINIGKPVNTELDEHALIVSTSGQYGYYASNQYSQDGSFDIVSFVMPDISRPEDIAIVSGFIDNIGVGAEVNFQKPDGTIIKKMDVKEVDGYYAAVLKKEDIKDGLLVQMKKKGFAYQSKLVTDTMLHNGKAKLANVEMKEIETGVPYRLNDIYFATNSAAINQTSTIVISQFAGFLMDHPSYRVQISGHTDNSGTPATNLKLSEDRAKAVRQLLIGMGISAERLTTKGYGETVPIADNNTETGKAKNRRTEFMLLD